MNWTNYDNWRLSTPYDNEIEIDYFKTEKYDYYSLNEKDVEEFDKRINEVEKAALKLEICPEDAAEELADELGLYSDKDDMIIEARENEQSEKEYVMQCRYDEMRGK